MPKARFHIAHVLPSPFLGGTEHATLRITQAIEGKDFKNTVFCPGESSPAKDMFRSSGLTTVSYRTVEPSYRHPKKFLRAAFELAREIKRRQIHLVHCADVLAAHYTALAGRLAGVPVLCHVRNRYEEISRRDKSFLHPVNKFAFVSYDTWRRFAYGVSSKRGLVVYDGIDVTVPLSNAELNKVKSDVRREFNIPATAKIIGMVACVAPQKDYSTLARAAARIVTDDPHVKFLIVGDNSETAMNREHYEEVKRMLSINKVDSHFIFTGLRSDVSRLIRAFDIFVLSTHWEGLPLVILEAMAESVPVVATAVDGIPEIVLDKETGLLHQHQDDNHLAEQILLLLGNQEFAADLGQVGRQFVEANFSKEQFASNMIDLYHDMLADRAPRPVEDNSSQDFNCRYPSDIS